MDSVLALWSAALGSLSALIGVVLGQLLQARRESRNWLRQANEQRRRDQESWQREDKHRFIVDKRAVYAEFNLSCGKRLGAIDELRRRVEREVGARRDRGEAPTFEVASSRGCADPVANAIGAEEEFFRAFNVIRLVAPLGIDAIAREFSVMMHEAQRSILDDCDCEKAAALALNAGEIRRLMRIDLSISQ